MRPLFVIVGFLGIILFPPWVTLLCIIFLSVQYRAWEAILMGACMDLVWLPPGTFIHSLPLFTIAAVFIVWGFEPLRAQFLIR